MKKLVSLFCLFVYFFNVSVFASEVKNGDYFAKNYNLNAKHVEVIERITDKYTRNTDIADEILSMNLLDDFVNSSIYYWDEGAMKLYFILKCKSPKIYTKSQLKTFTNGTFGKEYYIYLNGKVYKGISKINISDVSKSDEIYILYNSDMTKKQFRNAAELKQKYNLDNDTLGNIKDYTRDYKNTKVVEPALNDKLFDEFYECMGGNAWTEFYSMPEYEFFEKSYPVFKKLYNSKKFSKQEIKNLTISYNSALRVDDKYYKNFDEVTAEDLAKAGRVDFYKKNKFKNAKNFKKYLDFQREYKLDDRTMDYVWNDTYRLRKNKKLVDIALADGSLIDFHNYYDNRNFDRNYSRFFKIDYNSYLQLKEAGYFSKTQIYKVLTQNSRPCISFTPRYWGKNNKKIQKVLESKKIEQKNKYYEIIERISYRKANAFDFVNDSLKLVILVLLPLSGVGLIALANGCPFTFTAVKFK